MCLHTHVCMCTHTHVHRHMCIYVHVNNACMNVYTHMMYSCAHIHMHVCVHVYTISLIMYWFVGLRSGAKFFLIFWVTLSMLNISSQTFGVLCAYFTSTREMAKLASSPFSLFIGLSGFTLVSTPVYYDWIRHINFFRYTNSILMWNDMV